MNSKKINSLPNGDYHGRIYISADTVGDENSLDYGRKKFVVEIIPTENKLENEIVTLSRVILPHYLANEPSATDEQTLNDWRGASKTYFERTNELLKKCGVDVSETNGTEFVQQIAQNNISRPTVNFTMKDGVPTVHGVISRENPEALDAEPGLLPDGNEAPFGN